MMNCDIVLPVYNSLSFVKDCIESIIRYTYNNYTLFVIDDCSDDITKKYLCDIAKEHPQVIIHRNATNLGFVRSVNTGIRLGSAEYFVVVNSDVVVTDNWLGKMIKCAESDEKIAFVNPFTNNASNINLPIFPGLSFINMNGYLTQISQRSYPDVVTGVGFCMLMRRKVLEKVGFFDEIYGDGYCEESDLCMKLTTQGYRTVIADDVFVYHKGGATFEHRDERYLINRKIFDSRWKHEYEKQFREFLNRDPLQKTRGLFVAPSRWDPLPSMRETYREMRASYRKNDYFKVFKSGIKGAINLTRSRSFLINDKSLSHFLIKNRLSVTYIMDNLSISGGVMSVFQLVNELILMGVDARIATLKEYKEIYNWKLYTKPILYKNKDELIQNIPKTDIVIATHWTTSEWAAQIVHSGRANKSVYFIQDYEAWFYPEEQDEIRRKVIASYEMIPHRIVKSEWLSKLIRDDGFDTHKIRLGMDLGIYYPRRKPSDGKMRVISMARPRTPRRGFEYVNQAFEIIKQRMPEVEIVLFGDDLTNQRIKYKHKNFGVIPRQEKIAELYSQADVFLDGSNFQGFGRPALEAMACGTACVLTNVGGVNEYAKHDTNSILVPPKEPELFAKEIIAILKDQDKRETLIANGLITAKEYCHKREAQETLEYFKSIL